MGSKKFDLSRYSEQFLDQLANDIDEVREYSGASPRMTLERFVDLLMMEVRDRLGIAEGSQYGEP